MPRQSTKTETHPIVARAAVRGAEAFAAGLIAAPAADPGFSPLMKEACAAGVIIPALDAWNRAWHRANLAAPVIYPE